MIDEQLARDWFFSDAMQSHWATLNEGLRGEKVIGCGWSLKGSLAKFYIHFESGKRLCVTSKPWHARIDVEEVHQP